MNLLRAFYYEFIFSHLACSPHKFPFAFQLQQEQHYRHATVLAINTIYQRDSSGFTDALQFYQPLDCSSDNKCLLYHDDGGPEGEVSQAAEETCHHRRGS